MVLKIFAILFAALEFWLFCRMLYEDDVRGRIFQNPVIGFSYLAFLVGFPLFLLITSFHDRVKIYANKVAIRTIFGEKEILFKHVKGIRITEDIYGYSSIAIIPKSSEHKGLSVSRWYNKKDNNEIAALLSERLANIDEIIAADLLQSVLNNEAFGINRERRLQNVEAAQQQVKWLNIISVIAAAWALLLPDYAYDYIIGACIVIPLITLAAIRLSNGLIGFSETTAKPVLPAFAVIALSLRMLLDYNIIDHEKIWNLVFFIVAALMLLFLQGNKAEWKNFRSANALIKVFMVSAGVFISGFYAFGLVIAINCVYDTSKEKIYFAPVSDMHVHIDKHHIDYIINTGPLPGLPEGTSATVPYTLYHKLNKGDKVDVHIRPGVLKIPYYYVGR
ncbi:MAG: hypothetical protein V4543_06240 [Bacteroidota bacterium]